MGRKLREDVGLAGALGAELDEVVVVLDVRNQARQLDELVALAEVLGVQADGMHEQVHPLLGGEVGPALLVVVQVHIGHLNRLQVRDDPPHRRLVVVGVRHREDAPHAAATQKLLVGVHNAIRHWDAGQAQVGELRLVLVRLVVEDHVDLVDDLVASRRTDLVFDHLRIGAVDVVVFDHVANLVHPAVDDLVVVDGAVLAEQILEHIGRHRVVALDQ